MSNRREEIWVHGRKAAFEVRRSPTVRGLLAGGAVGALARGVGFDAGPTAVLGSAVALLQSGLSRGVLRLERRIISSESGASLAHLLPADTAFGGATGITGDLAALVAQELQARPEVIVECGAGVSTVLIAGLLKEVGAGRLYSIENDASYAKQIESRLERAGVADRVELIVAPLSRQTFGSLVVDWYDRKVVDQRVSTDIDLVLVDGPQSVSWSSRWPALVALYPKLAPRATILLDDGRRRNETRTAFRWADEFNDVSLYWIDTVKGTWKIVRMETEMCRSQTNRHMGIVRSIVRKIHPHPPGAGLSPVRRS